MSVRQRLNDRGRVVREVTVADGTPTVIETTGDWMPFNAEVPDLAVDPGGLRNPRAAASAWLLEWPEGYRDPGSLSTGFRVELASGSVLEILGPPRALKEGIERVTGWYTSAQELTALYPLTGELQDQGGVAADDITLAIWEFREDQERMGRFERYRGRVPIEFVGVARVNHQIDVNGVVFKIQEALTNLNTMTVDLTLSKPHG